MIAKQIIDKKREGRALGTAEIRDFIMGFTRGEIPDCQMSALAMAICCRGMTTRETADLTETMMRSGLCLEWPSPSADKHSTGGVGDKLSFVIQPLAAACGLRVPSLTGRGLGFTGGTADKLESIPGYRVGLSLDEMRRVVAETGVALAAQTDEICPADKKLYALRDVTGTVASIPLITASILSKKLAEGVDALVFDVKCGSGAFMKTREEASALAASLVGAARAAGRKAAALVTDMSAPLGFAVGNANEIEEALALLAAKRGDRLDDLRTLCVAFVALMLAEAKGLDREEARRLAQEKLDDGSAARTFEAMVAAQGGDLAAFARHRETVRLHRFRISAPRSGYIRHIDAETAAFAALELGAGRHVAGERIDHDAGITFAVRRGERVSVGSPLATLETATRPDTLEKAAAALLKAIDIVPDKCEAPGLILEEVL